MTGLAADLKALRDELAAERQEIKLAQARDERGEKTTGHWLEFGAKVFASVTVIIAAIITGWFAYSNSIQIEAMKSAVSQIRK